MRAVMRGTRKSPATMSRDGRRSSSRVPSAGASARGTKSIGTNQLRPSLTGGAGSETTRPAAEASAWPAVSVMVCVLVEMVRPPASASSREVRSNSRARSSSANISWPLMRRTGSGRRASLVSTVNGAGAEG